MPNTDKELSGEDLRIAILAFVKEAKELAILIEKMKGAGDNAAIALGHKIKRIKDAAPHILEGLSSHERL